MQSTAGTAGQADDRPLVSRAPLSSRLVFSGSDLFKLLRRCVSFIPKIFYLRSASARHAHRESATIMSPHSFLLVIRLLLVLLILPVLVIAGAGDDGCDGK